MDSKINEIHQLKQNKPRLRNKALIRDNVLAQIEQAENRQIHVQKLWYLIAATVLLMLSVASYTWFEVNTQYQRLETLTSINENYVPIEADLQCQYTMKSLISLLDQAGLEHVLDGNAIQITRNDLDYLRAINSPLVAEVEQFLVAVEKLYPLQYQNYLFGEGVRLSVWQLKSDQRICQWFN